MPAHRTPTPGQHQQMIVSRFGLIFFVAVFLAVCIGYRLVDNTVIHAANWRRMGDSTLTSVKPVYPIRGEILASDGSILATNLYFYNVMMDLRCEGFKIIEFTQALPELCDSMAAHYPPYDAKKWREKFDRQLALPKNKRSRNFVLCRSMPKAEYTRIRETFPFFRDCTKRSQCGLKSDAILKRSYPFGSMARLSIGRVGQTAECAEVHGRSGLECALDTLLYGIPGVQVRGLSTRGTKYVVDTPAVNGYDVYTTIDITIQDILESELGQMLLDAKAEWGAAMIMETATGDIKAMSNLELDKKSATPKYIEALNRCVLAYEPGSVMKVMSMAVALEKGYAKPVSREYPIGHTYNFLNRPIRDTHSPGSLPVSRFIEYSSNIGMVKLMVPHYTSNPKQFEYDLTEMGFFDRLNSGIGGETRPRFVKDPKLIDLSRLVFGYSSAIPPLYTCAFYNAVANDGKFVRPRLMRGLRTPEGVDSIIPVDYVRERILSSENAAILREMMHGVVWCEGGTAKILKNDLVEIAGKTGTCKIALERPVFDENGDSIKYTTPFKGGYREGHYRVTFCGFFPYDNPRYTCIVVINDPQMPYRGPAVSSGVVLKNVALKMYARGMLSENPRFDETSGSGDGPILYSSLDARRNHIVRSELNLQKPRALRQPADSVPAGCVPDVQGISLREALTRLESRGYSVAFEGAGYVASQSPAPGTRASLGTQIKLTLRHD
ncbi:MAG: PASTA domain-containing protein [Muribaculaceae bacterium]|nr:PASTA domain-containing protein [Muribaculaceae bacterium]